MAFSFRRGDQVVYMPTGNQGTIRTVGVTRIVVHFGRHTQGCFPGNLRPTLPRRLAEWLLDA